jgi:hypothetical protein
MYRLASPILYRSIITDDILALAYGWDKPAAEGNKTHRKSKKELLSLVRQLYTVGGVRTAWEDERRAHALTRLTGRAILICNT